MAYTAGWNVVAFEVPTAAKWNQLGANDDSFHDGSGIPDLPKLVNRQDDTTNSVVSNQLIQTGWGYMKGNNTVLLSENVTFPVAFDSVPIVIASPCSARPTAPATIGDLNGPTSGGSAIVAGANAITLSNFNLMIYRSDNVSLADTAYYGYTWIAIGTKAR